MKIVIRNAPSDSKMTGMMKALGMEVVEENDDFIIYPNNSFEDFPDIGRVGVSDSRGPARNTGKGKRRIF